MNSPTIKRLRTEWQALGTTPPSSAACQRPTPNAPEAELTKDPIANSAAADLPGLMAGDRLVGSVTEAGQLLGVSRAFAYELAARGELTTIRLGRRVLVPKVALLAMVGISHSHF